MKYIEHNVPLNYWLQNLHLDTSLPDPWLHNADTLLLTFSDSFIHCLWIRDLCLPEEKENLTGKRKWGQTKKSFQLSQLGNHMEEKYLVVWCKSFVMYTLWSHLSKENAHFLIFSSLKDEKGSVTILFIPLPLFLLVFFFFFPYIYYSWW